MTGVRSSALAEFLRKGLAPPPKRERPLDDKEQAGKAIFESEAAACATCHPSTTDFTNRIATPMRKSPPLPGFEDEDDDKFKTPSLLFVSGTPPYLHDGSAPTLAALIARNQDRMGKTTQLSEEQRAALVAYLETL